LAPHLSTCGLGLGKALLTDAERGISDPGGGLRSSKELLPLLAAEDVAGNVISLDVASGTVNGNTRLIRNNTTTTTKMQNGKEILLSFKGKFQIHLCPLHVPV